MLNFFSRGWKIRMSKSCKEKTTFVCRYGNFQFSVMLFGLMNAPSTFQRMMDELKGNLPFVKVYLDDVMVFFSSIYEHFKHLRNVLEKVSTRGLKVKIGRCELAKEEAALLGHIEGCSGVQVDPRKIEVIQQEPRSASKTELCSLLAIAGYYIHLIRSLAKMSASLHEMTSIKISFH